MPIQIQIDVSTGYAKIQRLQETVQPRTILDVIGARLLSYVDESFRTKGRGLWKPLSPLTLATRQFGGDMPLQDSGLYKMSYVMESDHKSYVEVGSNAKAGGGTVSLAKIHEYGTKGPYPIHSKTRIVRGKVVRKGGFASLVAKLRSGGYIFFGPIVMHPGVPARPVLPAKAAAEKLIQETIDGMFSRVTQDIAPSVFRSNRQTGR